MKTELRLIVAAFGLAILNLSAATLYVSLESTNPVPPYATWDRAAKVIQDAVDAARAGDTVLVTNGVYAVGDRSVTEEFSGSRVVVTNAIRLESVNGPLLTTIDGGGSVRCVYLVTNAVLSGLTLTNGFGGVFSEPSGVVTNCTLTGNSYYGAAGSTLYNCTLTGNWTRECGGGAIGSILYNCTLTGNSAWCGGGAAYSTLYNCTLTGNGRDGAWECTLYNCTLTGNGGSGAAMSTLYNCTLTGNEGGAWASTLYNCTVVGNDSGVSGTLFNSIVYYNYGGNYSDEGTGGTLLNYSCTTPLPTNGVGNITGPPLFMDLAAGDFRLREESPCIDAGTNLMGFSATVTNTWWGVYGTAYAHDPIDMLGNTRSIDGNGDGTVAWDIGAYEFNSWKAPWFAVHPQLTADGWKLNITGAANQWVHLQRSSNLKDWEEIWSGWMGAEGVHQCNDGDMGQKVMFYRVIVE